MFGLKPLTLPTAETALPGRDDRMPIPERHFVLDAPLDAAASGSRKDVLFGMGCFWGAERKFWQLEGVVSTSVGYAGGFTRNPTYREVCSGQTGHTEVVRVVYDESVVPFERLLQVFWENHDPTQGMRQGNDVGTQYRSAIYVSADEQMRAAERSRQAYAATLSDAGYGPITTEIRTGVPFFFAEGYHQQYLAKNPNGYCGIGGTGVRCPVGVGVGVGGAGV
jgi:peptide-methionine (S)-S-oxide reductase